MSAGPGRGAPLVFLERRTYRQRRLRDAARLLPVVGLFAWTVPLFWPTGPAGPTTSGALTYIFGVWVALVCAGALLARRGATGEEGSGDPGGDAGP